MEGKRTPLHDKRTRAGEMITLAQQLIELVPRIRRILAARLRRNGVRHSLSQLQILELIGEHAHTVSELAELQGVTRATMSATLSRMDQQGLIRRQKAPGDQRIVLIEPTAAGRAASEEAREKAEAILDEILATLSSAEKDTLMSGLDLLISAVARFPTTYPNEKED